MKTLINKTNPSIRITAPEPEIKVNIDTQTFYIGDEMFDMEDWTLLVEEEPMDLEKEVKRYLQEEHDRDTTVGDVARHFAKWGAEHFLDTINPFQQEQQKLYKDESLGSPDYERGFKHGRDYQTCVERKYTNKEKVVAYLIDKGYPVSTNGEIPTYQETFDIIKSAIEYANKQEHPNVDLDAIVNDVFDKYSFVDGYGQLVVSFNRTELYSFLNKIAIKGGK